jgi:maltooligosyltrehalose trehalohydrolase
MAAGVRFRLWAPGASRVELQLEEGPEPASLPMRVAGDGWFELCTRAAGSGSRYRYLVDGSLAVPDPASRFQPNGVHGPSMVVDPDGYAWQHNGWRGRAWHETALYELHVGTFSPEGTFDAIHRRLDHLVQLGISAIELMPVAAFSGSRGWGYDGVLPFAPHAAYGTPEDLKRLVDAAHGRGLMVFLDVVYNHFGPEGNYLHAYAPQFFTECFETPWGAAIDFSRPQVRDFFVHNALYWLEEFRFDGLRLDAVHEIIEVGEPDVLEALADAVHRRFDGEREVHLVLENDGNCARYLVRDDAGRPRHYVAQWNDDFHHASHVLATGEHTGYYADYAQQPVEHLRRCLAEGFAYQGEPSTHRGRRPRGEPSAHLPASAFVAFLQNHDQVGNRAFGERLPLLSEPDAMAALTVIMLLAPAPPLLFMGEEWGASEPFLFFCDFHDELAEQVREGRRREFARFPAFADVAARAAIPDPNAMETFTRSKLDWGCTGDAAHAACLRRYRALLRLRSERLVPRLAGLRGGASDSRCFGSAGLYVHWRLGRGAGLTLLANFAAESCSAPLTPPGRLLQASVEGMADFLAQKLLPPRSAVWFLDAP